MILDDWSQSRIKPHFQGTPMLPAQRELVIYLVFTLINLRSQKKVLSGLLCLSNFYNSNVCQNTIEHT